MNDDTPAPPTVPEAGPPEPPRDPNKRAARVRSRALTGLFILALFYTLYLGRSFFVPLVLALLLNVLLGPLVGGLARLRVPRGLGAALVVLGLVAAVGGSAYALVDPAFEWMEQAPRSLRRLEGQLRLLKEPVQKVNRATEEMEKLTSVDDGKAQPRQVEMRDAGLREQLWVHARSVVVGAVVLLILLYFLLASGDLFLRKAVRVAGALEEKRRTVEMARRVQSDLSKYLSTITLINAGLGVAVGVALYLYGVPNASLWGVMAALLNFIPYVGAIAGLVMVGLVSVATFDTTLGMILPPVTYFLITATEGYFVTPMVLGRRLTVNPVVILLGLLFWGWIWGIVGAVLAVPMLVTFRIYCEYEPRLAAVGEFLGR
jgi:predicted PurR-regulated permease PerM